MARKLKEAGWTQFGSMCWVSKFPMFCPEDNLIDTGTLNKNLENSCLSIEARALIPMFIAPSIGELLEALPSSIGQNNQGFAQILGIVKQHDTGPNKFYAAYSATKGEMMFTNESLPDALALMWIKLSKKP